MSASKSFIPNNGKKELIEKLNELHMENGDVYGNYIKNVLNLDDLNIKIVFLSELLTPEYENDYILLLELIRNNYDENKYKYRYRYRHTFYTNLNFLNNEIFINFCETLFKLKFIIKIINREDIPDLTYENYKNNFYYYISYKVENNILFSKNLNFLYGKDLNIITLRDILTIETIYSLPFFTIELSSSIILDILNPLCYYPEHMNFLLNIVFNFSVGKIKMIISIGKFIINNIEFCEIFKNFILQINNFNNNNEKKQILDLYMFEEEKNFPSYLQNIPNIPKHIYTKSMKLELDSIIINKISDNIIWENLSSIQKISSIINKWIPKWNTNNFGAKYYKKKKSRCTKSRRYRKKLSHYRKRLCR